jgi:flagellar biosynthesis/type III secretory pathway chaperone
MQPQACREKFARCLSEESELLVTLEQQLLREYELLTSNDIEGLESASGGRQQTVARLLRVDDERRGLCRARNLEADAGGLATLLAWCDATGSLAAAQARCAELAQRCRTQNERNGALVTARLNRVNGMLGMIAGENHSRTYQSGSATRASNLQPTGRMVSTSA